jgi:hypothetical protein
MADFFDHITDELKSFIDAQHMFVVGTAAADGRVNVSPKGIDTLRVKDPNRILWLNLTGSGNETAAHLLDTNRITIMFCSFEGKPLILRLYGTARMVHPRDEDWNELVAEFPTLSGTRQVVDVTITSVQTSCGYAVPKYDFVGERDGRIGRSENKGDDGIHSWWTEHNQTSIDGLPTQILNDT